MSETTVAQPVIKRKTFTYETELSWLINRAGRLESVGKPSFRVSSPPEFKGEQNVWTPEDLYVGAINACTMSTFLAFAEKRKLPLLSYSCKAEGRLEFVDGSYRITEILLLPEIVLAAGSDILQAEKILDEAHQNCFLTNSVNTKVILNPNIIVQGQ